MFGFLFSARHTALQPQVKDVSEMKKLLLMMLVLASPAKAGDAQSLIAQSKANADQRAFEYRVRTTGSCVLADAMYRSMNQLVDVDVRIGRDPKQDSSVQHFAEQAATASQQCAKDLGQ
jgi:hypothetical protein